MRRQTKRNLALGDLQTEVMAAIWKLGEATVDDVRELQRPGQRSAYNTVQTVMNRLLDRGLLTRQRRGKAFVYRARYDESQLIAMAMREQLAGAAPDTRRAALLSLVGELAPDEVDELARQANRIRRARGKAD
ncbi:MAG: BlaI/MecI/CopY family transcriptional regulator [Thermoleophilaceae bacterium]|nr:BlaI/MecI/CopY family transcriptional regulator [Thermoleophilaceae bacterium]